MLDPRLVLIGLDGELTLACFTYGSQTALGIVGEFLRHGARVLRRLFDHRGLEFRQTVELVIEIPFLALDDDALFE